MHLEPCQKEISVDKRRLYANGRDTKFKERPPSNPTSHSITERLPSVDTRNKVLADFEDTIMEMKGSQAQYTQRRIKRVGFGGSCIV
jgi:hypothetical protein